MKLKLFLKLYCAYILVGLNIIITYLENAYHIPIVILFYYFFIGELNRIGFVNRKMIILIMFYIISLGVVLGWGSYVVYLSVIMVIIIVKIHIPHRSKIKLLINRININLPVQIYYDRMVQSGIIIEYGYRISESEMSWLTMQILLRSNELKHTRSVYVDNEIIGNNFHVNIA